MNRRDLESRMQLLLDGELSEAEERETVELLKDNEEALELYCQYAELDSALARLTHGEMALADEDSIAAIAEKRIRFRSAKLTWLAAAAVLALSLVALRIILVKDEPPILTVRPAADTIYEITHTQSGESDHESGALQIGSRLTVTQGTMELSFASGVQSIVQAPVDLTVHAGNHIHLHQGTAWFRVPAAARGFRVTTPELELVDLGTEFGVLATPRAGDEIHVFEGAVQVRSRNPLRNETTLTADQARLSDPAGRLVQTDPRPREFLTSLPASLPHLYFSFDSESAGQFTVDGSHPAAGQVTARLRTPHSTSRLVPGVRGKAIALDGTGTFIRTDWPGFSGTTPRSLACWIRLEPGVQPASKLPALVGWGDPTNGINSKWKVHVSRQNEQGLLLPRLSFGPERYDGTTPLDDGSWHHLVVIYRGTTLNSGLPDVAMYLDGKREQLTRRIGARGHPETPQPIRTLTNSDNARPLEIGRGVIDMQKTFRGDLDELYLYEGALSEESIQRLRSAPHSVPRTP